MPRNTQQASRRVAVQSTDAASSYQVVAPSQVNTRSSTADTAAALSSALGLAGEVYAAEVPRRQEADFRQGVQDHQTGTVQADQSEAYGRAVSQLDARASWYQDAPQILERVRERVSMDEASVEELDTAISEEFAGLYGGLDDPHAAEILVPLMERFRNTQRSALVERQQQIVLDRQVGNFSIAMGGQVDEALAAASADIEAATAVGDLQGLEALRASTVAGAVDWNVIHDDLLTMFNGDGSRANAAMAEVVTRVATERGLPELIDSIPARWADGTPTLAHIPAYADGLAQARTTADARAASDVRQALAEGRDEYVRNTLMPLDIAISEGRIGRSQIMSRTDLQPEDQRSMLNRVLAVEEANRRAATAARNAATEEAVRSHLAQGVAAAMAEGTVWAIDEVDIPHPTDPNGTIHMSRADLVEAGMDLRRAEVMEAHGGGPEAVEAWASELNRNNQTDPQWERRLTGSYSRSSIRSMAETGEVDPEVMTRFELYERVGRSTADRHIRDAETRDFFEMVNIAKHSGMDTPAAILHAARASENPPPPRSRDFDDAVTNAVSGLRVRDRLRDGWFGARNVQLSDTSVLYSSDWISNHARLFSQSTGMSPENVVQSSVEAFRARHVVVNNQPVEVPMTSDPTSWQATLTTATTFLAQRGSVEERDVQFRSAGNGLYSVMIDGELPPVGVQAVYSVGQLQRLHNEYVASLAPEQRESFQARIRNAIERAERARERQSMTDFRYAAPLP
jgi:hypothetical protein